MTASPENCSKPVLVCLANGTYCEQTSGGEIHFFHMVESALEAGFTVNIFGGHALEQKIRGIFGDKVAITLTDKTQVKQFNAETFLGQLRLLGDYCRRLFGTFQKLKFIRETDLVYAASDYWFDVWPLLVCPSRRKLMILGMDAPTIKEIFLRSRPDVSLTRLNSIYYWLSQNLSLVLFRFCANKRLFYVHPDMKPRLLQAGYEENETVFISNGMNLKAAEKVPDQSKEFDVIWLGRVHRQKGIDDLLATLLMLSQQVKDFRAVLVGRLNELAPRLAELGLDHVVKLSGLVSEEEKFRLFKASRVFLMPSRQESWGIVIAEALACETAVVAYDLPAYRPIFGELVKYIPCFDFEYFKTASLEAVNMTRTGRVSLDPEKLRKLKSEHSWEAAGSRFVKTLENL